MRVLDPDKINAQKQWNKTPCGTGDYLKGVPEETKEYFEAIRNSRYEITDKWMKQVIPFSSVKGKKLLEMGHGIGTDLLTFCENGAEVYGIDITQKHHDLAKRNFELHGKNAELKICDAANISYPSNYFDIVYSHGVLHHTPDTERCISEAHRVLKPGGLLILGMYHKYSAFHIFAKILRDGIIKGWLLKLGYRGLMATLEHGADGINIKPLVKTYSKRQLKKMLTDFSNVEVKIDHLDRDHHYPKFIKPFIPESLVPTLSRNFGWYVVAFATK